MWFSTEAFYNIKIYCGLTMYMEVYSSILYRIYQQPLDSVTAWVVSDGIEGT